MKFSTLVVALLCFYGLHGQSIYPLFNGQLWGYVNRHGKVIVKPRFHSCRYFSEGLAAVRAEGLYGYIDTLGKMVIEPKFDLAQPFELGRAKVLMNGRTFFIDKNGKILFESTFEKIDDFGLHTYAVASTKSGKSCLIDRMGKMLTDTVFRNIGDFQYGVAIVEGLHHSPYETEPKMKIHCETGVIDSSGRWVVRYGRYREIEKFLNGYAVADRNVNSKGNLPDALIDTRGNVSCILSGRYRFDTYKPEFHCRRAVVSILLKREGAEDGFYRGVINPLGDMVLSDTSWESSTPFTCNRAFVKIRGEQKWKIIDTLGRSIGDSTYEEIMFGKEYYNGNIDELFIRGVTHVKASLGWVSIDTNGRQLSLPVSYNEALNNQRRLKFGDDSRNLRSSESNSFCTSWKVISDSELAPICNNLSVPRLLGRGILYITANGSYLYHGTEKTEWKEVLMRKKDDLLNIDFGRRGDHNISLDSESRPWPAYFWTYCDTSGYNTQQARRAARVLRIALDTNLKMNWRGYKGLALKITNISTQTIYFPTMDGELRLTMQAKDRDGRWKDLEYHVTASCGNSYFLASLHSKKQLDFAVPHYDGSLKTRIRAKLVYTVTEEKGQPYLVFSNEIDGKINAAQFYNYIDYSPYSLMEPPFE